MRIGAAGVGSDHHQHGDLDVHRVGGDRAGQRDLTGVRGTNREDRGRRGRQRRRGGRDELRLLVEHELLEQDQVRQCRNVLEALTGELRQPRDVLGQAHEPVRHVDVDRVLSARRRDVQRPRVHAAAAGQLRDGDVDELPAAGAGLRAGHAGDDLRPVAQALALGAGQLVPEGRVHRVDQPGRRDQVERHEAGGERGRGGDALADVLERLVDLGHPLAHHHVLRLGRRERAELLPERRGQALVDPVGVLVALADGPLPGLLRPHRALEDLVRVGQRRVAGLAERGGLLGVGVADALDQGRELVGEVGARLGQVRLVEEVIGGVSADGRLDHRCGLKIAHTLPLRVWVWCVSGIEQSAKPSFALLAQARIGVIQEVGGDVCHLFVALGQRPLLGLLHQ